jgi:hypothetical protein
LTDGGPGDGDGVVNLFIADPGGPAVPATTQSTVGYLNLKESSPQIPEYRLNMPADLSVKYLNVQPQQVSANQPVTVYANITNGGDDTGNYVATLKINDKIEQVQKGEIKGHSAVPIKFTVYKDEPGIYTVDINGQKSTFSIINSNSSIDSVRNLLTIMLVILAAVILIICVLMVLRKQRNTY